MGKADKFWEYAEALGDSLERETSAKNQYSIALESAVGLLSTERAHVLRLAMGLRYFSPALEIFRQLEHSVLATFSEELQASLTVSNCAWAWVVGTTITISKPEDLDSTLALLTPRLQFVIILVLIE